MPGRPGNTNVKARILVVDDFELVRLDLMSHLKELGNFQIEQAASGLDALNSLRKAKADGRPFNLVFCDWNMPGMNGIDALRECRQDPEISGTNFIMVTSESDSEKIMEALEAGANDYVVKPLHKDALEKKLARFLK